MKILIISFYYYPDLSAGSFRTEAFVKALLSNLPEHAEVELITTLPNRYSSFQQEAALFEVKDRLTVHRVRLPSHQSGIIDQVKAFVFFAIQVFKLTQNKKYKAIYATSSRLMTGFLGALISRKLKIPLYLDIRDIFVDTIQDVFSRKISFFVVPIFTIIEKFTMKQADKINLVSKGFKSYFDQKFSDKNYSYFTNGIDHEFLDNSFVEQRKTDQKSILTVLYAGNIGEGQGLHEIIPQLSERLKDEVRFVIVGDGGRKKALLSSCEKLLVDIRPPVGRKELINLYKDADVLFLHLNDYKAFEKVLPSKMFEYAATGKPIWAGIAGYSATFAKGEISNMAVFPPCDVEKAVAAFKSLKIQLTNRSDFIRKYSRDTIMKKMSEDFISLLCRSDGEA